MQSLSGTQRTRLTEQDVFVGARIYPARTGQPKIAILEVALADSSGD